MQPGQPRIIGPWMVLTLLSLAFVLNYIDRQIVFTIFPLLHRDLTFSDFQLGLTGSLFAWTYSLCMPFAGRLADKWPRPRLVITAVVLWSFATLGTALSFTPTQFLCWRVAMGISESLYVPAAIGMITIAHPGSTRSRALSIYGFAQFTGITLGGWYGGWTAEHFGWRWGFGSLVIVGLLYAGFLAVQFRGVKSAAVFEGYGAARDLLRSRCYLALCGAFLLFCSILWMLYAWLPDHIFEAFHLSLAKSGLTATLYLQASSAIGVLVGGILGDLSSRRAAQGRFNIVALGLFFCAPFATAIYSTASLPILELSACGFGLFSSFVAANVFATLPEVVGRKNVGLATGLLNLAGGLGAGSAILLTGLLRHRVTTAVLMATACALTMVAAILLFLIVKLNFHHDQIRVSGYEARFERT